MGTLALTQGDDDDGFHGSHGRRKRNASLLFDLIH